MFRIAHPTAYPLNTPRHLVPFTLPTQCNTLIGLYVLGQLFNDFEKTCKIRITPTGITEGERGFEQTKQCYLTEVMPFFKLLKEHFEGLKNTINDDVTQMKKVFDEVESEGNQLAIDLKHSEIDRKNILIMNETLIANCIAKDVFYTVTDSALSARQFHEMSVTLNVFQNHVIELEGENYKLTEKIQNDDHDNMVRNFSKLEVDNLNLQLKYQHLEESIKTSNAKISSDAPEFDTCFELAKNDEVIQAHSNTIRKLKVQIAQLKSNRSDVINTNYQKSMDSQNFQKQGIINELQHENEWLRAEMSNAKQRYKELFESIKTTRDQNNEKVTSLLNEIENLKTMVKGKMPVVSCDHAISNVHACNKYACDAVNVSLPLRNNKLVHNNYLRNLKDCLAILRETVEDERISKPLDNVIIGACFLTNRAQELLEYAIGSCPKNDTKSDRTIALHPLSGNKHVTIDFPQTMPQSSILITSKQVATNQTNVPIIASTGVKGVSNASKSLPKGNTKHDRTLPAKSSFMKEVEESSRNNKVLLSERNRVVSNICVNNDVINSNSDAICKTCKKCLFYSNHDACAVPFLKSTMQSPNMNVSSVKRAKQVWNKTRKVFTNVGYQWRPTGRKFTLRKRCPVSRITNSRDMPIRKWRPTGRLFPIEAIDTTSSSSASKCEYSSEIPVTYDNPIFVCSNQTDPNCVWGSSFFSYPRLSGFKCRSYKSSFGIWTQAAQNI
jgi:predicted nuclease with TOPRIM domain